MKPLLSYDTLYELMKLIFVTVITVVILMQLYAWRPRKSRSVWRELKLRRGK